MTKDATARNKLIRIGDRHGWDTVDEYTGSPFVDDDVDATKLRQAELRAIRKRGEGGSKPYDRPWPMPKTQESFRIGTEQSFGQQYVPYSRTNAACSQSQLPFHTGPGTGPFVGSAAAGPKLVSIQGKLLFVSTVTGKDTGPPTAPKDLEPVGRQPKVPELQPKSS